MSLTRRTALRSAAVLLAAPAIVKAEGARTLRFIPHADLASLDPMWTTADITRNHGNMIYDQLYGMDKAYQARPQMLAGHRIDMDGRMWELTLRVGLKFHDGEPVLARDCVASVTRWSKRDAYGSALAARMDEITAASDNVIRIRLKKPFDLLPEALAQPALVIMPERVAKTDPNMQISEPIGSGPYRFIQDERLPGVRSVYARFEGYVPRPDGKTSFLAGPRIVYFDRAEWTYQPDPSTAAAAMAKGEFDWWENPSFDLLGLLRRDRDLRVEVKNIMGSVGCLRFNQLHPPFNNVAVRRLVLACIDQSAFMEAVAGAEPELNKTKIGLFPPGMPMANEAGTEALLARTDFDQVRLDLAAAGYQGEKIVFMGPSKQPVLHAQSQVANDLLGRMGFNMDYQSLEWGTVVQRRASKELPERGGWNAFVSNLTSLTNVFVPAQIAIRGGPNSWFGWPDVPRLDALREDWLNATTSEAQHRIATDLQRQMFADVPYCPLGQFFQPAAFHKSIVDIQSGWPVMHAVRRV
jgi:peptide/nickel transport system substrate-binding protein